MSQIMQPIRRRVCASGSAGLRHYSAPATRAIPEAKQKYVPSEGVYPKGFVAGTAHARVKASNTKYDDVTLIASEKPCNAAAVFTRNRFKAAPVRVSKETLVKTDGLGIRGVVINAGCANAITGTVGVEHAHAMASKTDECFGGEAQVSKNGAGSQTLVMSTGVIGQRLPIGRILDAIPQAHANLGSTHEHWLKAANAICTTDTFPKLRSRTFTLPSQPDTTFTLAGITKGAGMIHPNLATLLGVICTDAYVPNKVLRSALTKSAEASFNSISIDGDTSTNDTVALFANGAAASSQTFGADDASAFEAVLTEFMRDLAQLVVRDGEGATKFVSIHVESAASPAIAKEIAMSIARSPLVKTALYGKDANWGRILCAIGYAPSALTPSATEGEAVQGNGGEESSSITLTRTSVSFVPADGSPELKLLTRGEPEEVDEVRAQQILDMEELQIRVSLNDTTGSPSSDEKNHNAIVWTCDFSHEYVTINGDYRT